LNWHLRLAPVTDRKEVKEDVGRKQQGNIHMKFQVLMAASMKMTGF
jgi:hypothetical protein